jgi:DNA-binding CsgD family transcriptional regulator
VGAPARELGTAWPLVGREVELARISEARERGCCGVVVRAGAGVGKTRLGREAVAAAERGGAMVEWVQATRSAAEVPLGAFASLLPAGARSDEAFTLLRDSARALGERAGGRPIVIGVDDAQLLDPVSATLVLQLATGATAFVIATVRSGEPCPDAIVSLWKDAGAPRLELGSLSDEEVRHLVETALDGPVEQEALGWVTDRSRGNALYARELVRGAVEGGWLQRAHGLWRLVGSPAVAESLVELVGRRMLALTAAERLPVELLALGEPLRPDELTVLSSVGVLSAAERGGLITVDAHDEVRLAHPLYGDVLRARIPTLRARGLRVQLAEALQQRGELSSDETLRVIRLLLDAHAPIPSALLLDGAWAANLSGDPRLGIELAARAAADGGGLSAALALAHGHRMCDEFAEAEAALAPIEPDVPGDPAAIAYLEQRLRVLYWGLGRVADTRALLDRAASWSDEPWWAPRLFAVRMTTTLPDGLAEAIDAAEAVLAQPGLDAETRRLIEPRHAIALFYAGRWDEGYAVAQRSRLEIPIREYGGIVMLHALRLAGAESGADWPGLEATLARILAESVRSHDHEATAQAALGLGHLAFLRGRFRDATRWLAEAERQFEREDAFGTIFDVLVLQVATAYCTGDADEAGALLERLREESAATQPRALYRPAYLLRAEGWVACARNPAAGAAQLLHGAETLAADKPGLAALLVYDALLAGAPASTAGPRLADLAPRCQTRLVDAYTAHGQALAARDGAALLEAAERFAGIGATRYAVAAASGAAAVFLDAGRGDSARRAAARARELHEPGQGTDPPSVDGLHGAAVALTARESQMVGLASQGLTNADIADRLVISVRTVETHLYRAMQKLGINDRRDL